VTSDQKTGKFYFLDILYTHKYKQLCFSEKGVKREKVADSILM
jgi:hypothetical protein